ncbi:unannotated protein [freshwater metagenome]|uniref:Unannotated protein n=1 Tax=freshwater metagenome TaxID=449393 RepID=A0A6J7BKQ9_9ZZZZ
MPAVLHTAPSGASDPPRIVIPPVAANGFSTEYKMSPSAAGGAISAKFSAIVLPVTVRQSPCNNPASRSARITTGIPPTLSTSVITKRPNGLRSPRSGTRAPIRLKSSSVRSTSASCAIASKCSTAFVDPPSAITTVIAFSKAFLVRMSRAVIP